MGKNIEEQVLTLAVFQVNPPICGGKRPGKYWCAGIVMSIRKEKPRREIPPRATLLR
jgi:hypothetical protein